MLRRFLLFFLILALPARANLGETVEQCVVRYGRPIVFTEANAKFPFGTLTFIAHNYALVVYVFNDQEVGARISKVDKSAFADTELQNIMTADSRSPWVSAPSDDPTCLQWSRGDKATVIYDKTKHVLIFTAPEMAQVLNSTPGK